MIKPCKLLLFISCSINAIFISPTVFAADHDATIGLPTAHELSLPVSGVIKILDVTPGQRVTKGKVMLTLDPVPFNAAKTHAQSRVTVQKTLLTESQRDYQQQQELYDRTVLALVDLENAKLKVTRDRANLEDANASLANAKYALAYSKLVAPFDALVLSVHVNQGQSINNALQSKRLITLVEQGKHQATFYVTPEELEKINIGEPVTISSDSKKYPGEISRIAYESSKENKNLISAIFKTPDRKLLIGHKASVHID